MRLKTDVDIDAIFQYAFTRAGSPVIDCNCGRHHVCIDSYAFQNGPEDEEMRKEYIREDDEGENENLVLHYEIDHLSVIEINNLIFAEDCECQGWVPYRDFLFAERTHIRNFLVRLASEAQQALELEKTFNILSDKKLMKSIDEPEF